MGRGPKKHLKRVAAPSHWLLDKLSGNFAPRPSPGPHKLRECIPLVILLRDRLKYALTYQETKIISRLGLVQVDGKIRTDHCYPIGFMDIISIPSSGEHFRLLYDTKKRFVPCKISASESHIKYCRVIKIHIGNHRIPHAVTHDGRTLRFINPSMKVGDTVIVDLNNPGQIYQEFLPFDVGSVVMVTNGNNIGRVGTVQKIIKQERHFAIVEIEDEKKKTFSTRSSNIFVIGNSGKICIELPGTKGIRLTRMEDRKLRIRKSKKITAVAS